jgi:hypothetical protein
MNRTDFFRPATADDWARLFFFRLVEDDLQQRHVGFDAAELEAFVTDVWPLVEAGMSLRAGPRRSW